MKNVKIEVFPIARTMVDRNAVRRWLDHVGADNYEVPTTDTATDPALLIALAAKRCYMSFEPGLNPNVTRVRSDLVEYFDNILKSGHGSVLEHASYTFAIEGVSRVFTGEMNRHRAGWAISEGSMRFIRFTDIPWWLPTSLEDQPGDNAELLEKKRRTRDEFGRAFTDAEEHYKTLLDIWEMDSGNKNFSYKKKLTSCLRRIIPMGVATGGVWTGNIRALRHVIALRTSSAAEEEILLVFSMIAKSIRDTEPLLFGDFEQTTEGYWVPKYQKV